MSAWRWCGAEGPTICRNTRDMKDNAIEDRERCRQAPVDLGGGEKEVACAAAHRRMRTDRR